jgi:hypothetical protein
MRRGLQLSLLALLSFGVSAETISEYVGGTGSFSADYHFGQLITTPVGGPWDNINFSFVRAIFNDPGKLYLLSQEYLGLSGDLAEAPGLIATSIGRTPFLSPYYCGLDPCAWIFDSSVVLQPNTTYYFYEDGTWGG